MVPDEILSEICKYLLAWGHVGSLAALAATFRRLSDIAIPLLYHLVTIDDPQHKTDARVGRLLRTYKDRPDRIQLLKHLKLGLGKINLYDRLRVPTCMQLLLSHLNVTVASQWAPGSDVPSMHQSCFNNISTLDLHGPLSVTDLLNIVDSPNLRKLTLHMVDALDLPRTAPSRQPNTSPTPLEIHFLKQCAIGASILHEIIHIRPLITGLIVPFRDMTTWYCTAPIWPTLTPHALQTSLQPLRQTLQYLTVTDDQFSKHHQDISQEVLRLNKFTTLKRLSLPSTFLTTGAGYLTRLDHFQQNLPPTLENLQLYIPPYQHWIRSPNPSTSSPAPDCAGLLELVGAKVSKFPGLVSIRIEEVPDRRDEIVRGARVVDLPDNITAAAREAGVEVCVELVGAGLCCRSARGERI